MSGISDNDIAVARYLSNGQLDPAFKGGFVTTTVDNFDLGQSVAIQPNGKIVVAGYSENGSKSNFAVVRYTITGSLDTNFNNTGKLTTPLVIILIGEHRLLSSRMEK